MDSKQKVAVTFGLYRSNVLLSRETVTQDIIKVGKDPRSHLRIDDEHASRMHAVIEVTSPEEITVIDLGNEPGTLVNGARINKCPLQVGDQLQVGSTKIMLERAEPVALASAAPERAPVVNPFTGVAGTKAVPAVAVPGPFGVPAGNPFASADPFGYANPFVPAPAPTGDEVPADALEGSYTYTLLKSAPEVPADEVEDARAASVEVMILWETTALHVQHLTPPRSYYVGEEQGKNLACDFFIPSEKLGTTRAPVLLADRGGPVSVVLLPGSTGTIEVPGQPKLTVRQAIEQGRVQPCAELSSAYQMALPPGSKAKIEVGGLVFQISTGNAGRAIAGGFAVDTQSLLYAGLSLAAHAGLLAAMAFFMPPLGTTDEDGVSADQVYSLQQYLKAAAEKEQEDKPTENTADARADDREGGTGNRARNEEGSMGNPTSHATGHRFGIQGPANNTDVHVARAAALQDAAGFGVIGLLNSGAGGDPNAPTAFFGRDESLGNDPISARGNMWGNDIGEAFGAGGLGLTGVGEGGGGRGEGIGLGTIGTIGHGAGTGSGSGFGSGHGHIPGRHTSQPPHVRAIGTSVSGRLPPEVVQRIVRQNFGRFRLCYENGLRSSPNLQGRVAVRFVIGRDGAVSNVGNGGSDLPDPSVVSCVQRAFYGLSFPQPEGGIVTVTYPIMFSPGG